MFTRCIDPCAFYTFFPRENILRTLPHYGEQTRMKPQVYPRTEEANL